MTFQPEIRAPSSWLTGSYQNTDVEQLLLKPLGEVNLGVTNDGTGETTNVYFVVVPNEALTCRNIQ